MENNLCCLFNKIAECTPGLCKSLHKTDVHLLLLDISGQVSNLEQKHENAKKASSQSVSTGKVEEVTNIFASAGDIERPMDRAKCSRCHETYTLWPPFNTLRFILVLTNDMKSPQC